MSIICHGDVENAKKFLHDLSKKRFTFGLVASYSETCEIPGITIAGAASGYLLEGFGYIANQEQTPEALMGIRIIFCILPGSLALANGLLLILYPLSQEKTEQIHAELEVIRNQ